MATNLLTDKAINAALKLAAAEGKTTTLKDGDGMTLMVRLDRTGWWRLRYWIDSRENRLSLGIFPEVGLAMARQRRDDARRLIAAGVDPSQERKAAKAERTAKVQTERLVAKGLPQPGCFEAVAREWLAEVHNKKVSAGHAERTRIRFEQDAFPWIGSRPLVELDAPLMLEVLRRVVSRGAIETAHRLKDACGQVFRYGIATGVCKRNPIPDLIDALPVVPARHFAAVTQPQEAAELLRAMTNYAGHPVTRAALSLSALLFLRPGELRQMEWTWVDLEACMVTLPPALMKRRKADKVNGPPHLVPLAPQAAAVLRELRPLTGDGRYVFPSMLSRDRPMSENTVNVALRRMGFDRETATAHGFRAMARTMAVERLGVDTAVIEAQLAHAVADALGRSYNRTSFVEQRRELMNRWADYIDCLRSGADVIPLSELAA